MKVLRQSALATLACVASTASLAHTGHGTESFFAGLVHPLAIDHLLAALAVGVWAAAVLPAGRRVLGPVVFMAALFTGAMFGLGMNPGSWLEFAIAASIAVFGAMLLAQGALPIAVSLGVIAAAALLHGLAHGAELPAHGGFSDYASGFLVTTAVLQAIGLAIGSTLVRAQRWAWQATATVLGCAAVALVTLA